jgi:hypothetical protein
MTLERCKKAVDEALAVGDIFFPAKVLRLHAPAEGTRLFLFNCQP